MHATSLHRNPQRPAFAPSQRIGELAAWTLVLAVVGMSTGCQGKRFLSPLASRSAIDGSSPSMHGPSLAKFDQDPSGVRVTSAEAVPETGLAPVGLAPVEQRLATAKSAIAKPAAAMPPIRPASARSNLTQSDPNHPDSTRSPASGPEIEQTTYSESVALDPRQLERPENRSEVPSEYEGVDVSELMKALQDAPPEVQKAAIGRLIAMSRQRAKPTTQPMAIEEALAASFDSLPPLPDEVIDRGLSPKRLAADQTQSADTTAQPATAHEMTLSDQETVQTIPAEEASTKHSRVSQAAMEQPVEAQAKDELNAAMIEKVSANQSSTDLPAPDEPIVRSVDSLTDAQLFDALVARLQVKVDGESEADRHRRTVMTRHLLVLAGDPDRAVEKIDGLSNEEQEFLRHQLLGLWTIIDPNGHPVPSRRLSSALPEMRKATGYLAAASDSLEVRGLQFCTEIEAYGEVTPFPERRFEPGQEVILYCEVENFVAADLKEGFETRLQGSYDLLDRDGRRVSSQTLPEDRQVTNNRLRD